MEANVEFVGWRVGPKEEVSVSQQEDEDVLQTFHTTQVAFGEDPAPGRHTVFVTTSSGRYAIGTLEKGKCEQFSIDFMGAAEDLTFSHTGTSEVFITGYKTLSVFMSDDDEGMIMGEDEMDDDEEDDEEAPEGVPLRRRKLKVCP